MQWVLVGCFIMLGIALAGALYFFWRAPWRLRIIALSISAAWGLTTQTRLMCYRVSLSRDWNETHAQRQLELLDEYEKSGAIGTQAAQKLRAAAIRDRERFVELHK